MSIIVSGESRDVSGGSSASEFRQWMHERTLEVAGELLLEHGWDKVRVGQIATGVGVSRPTIYAEFGNKEGIAEELVLAETHRFLVGVEAQLDRHVKDPEKALRSATVFTFKEAQRSPLLRAILTSTEDGSDTMLPLLTTRSEPLFQSATEFLVAWFREHYPDIHRGSIADAIDAVVRLVVSNLMFPGTNPTRTPRKVGNIAVQLIGELLPTTA